MGGNLRLVVGRLEVVVELLLEDNLADRHGSVWAVDVVLESAVFRVLGSVLLHR